METSGIASIAGLRWAKIIGAFDLVKLCGITWMIAMTTSWMGSSLSDEHKSNKNTMSWVGLVNEHGRRLQVCLGIKSRVRMTGGSAQYWMSTIQTTMINSWSVRRAYKAVGRVCWYRLKEQIGLQPSFLGCLNMSSKYSQRIASSALSCPWSDSLSGCISAPVGHVWKTALAFFLERFLFYLINVDLHFLDVFI